MSSPSLPGSELDELLRRHNGGAVELIGQGMEGAVYRAGPDRVAKLWFDRTPQSVTALQAFYRALNDRALPFAVPVVHDVRQVGGRTVSLERTLTGDPLKAAVSAGAVSVERARAMVVEVLAALAEFGDCPEARQLPVLDELTPLARPTLLAGGDFAGGFARGLAELASRRAARYATVLAPVVAGFERLVQALLVRLPEVDSGRRTVIHGDLVTENLLVAGGSVQAVLDWGFLSAEGDPAFDAAIAAAVFDMYSEHALRTELAVYELIEAEFGYRRADLLVYRAAYSLVTANVYSPDGSDGHFAWCVATLNRSDVVAAIFDRSATMDR